MKRRFSTIGIVVGTAALVASSLLAAAPAAHATGTGGTLVIKVVDQYGRPTTGIMEVVDAAGTQATSTNNPTPIGSTETLDGVPAGGYEVLGATPWAGISCAGISPCDLASSPSTYTPVVTVTDGDTSTYTMKVTVPSITGGTKIGSPLTIKVPAGLSTLETDLAAQAPAGTSYSFTQQWLRGATAISGATKAAYTTVTQDGGQRVAALLTPAPAMAALFGPTGVPVSTLTTNSIAVARPAKLGTRTTVSVPKRIALGARASITVRVRSTTGTPKGYVTVTIGQFKARKSLLGGAAFITVPRLKVGKYKATTRYAGTTVYAASTGNPVYFTVHR